LDKPIAMGFSILELSKLLMFDFYYNKLKKRYSDKVRLLMTDTDSLVYEVETENLERDLFEMREHFDLSNFPKSHPLYDETNKAVVGKFKIETGHHNITEFVGIRSKVYSFLTDNLENSKKLKGIKKSVVKDKITHEDYKQCLVEGLKQYATFQTFGTELHQIYTKEITKTSLSITDNKRYYTDAFTSYPYGYKL